MVLMYIAAAPVGKAVPADRYSGRPLDPAGSSSDRLAERLP